MVLCQWKTWRGALHWQRGRRCRVLWKTKCADTQEQVIRAMPWVSAGGKGEMEARRKGAVHHQTYVASAAIEMVTDPKFDEREIGRKHVRK